jgi:hypothetical protein
LAEDKKARKRRLRKEQMRRYRDRKKQQGYVLKYVPIAYSTKRIGLKLARPNWRKPKRRK